MLFREGSWYQCKYKIMLSLSPCVPLCWGATLLVCSWGSDCISWSHYFNFVFANPLPCGFASIAGPKCCMALNNFPSSMRFALFPLEFSERLEVMGFCIFHYLNLVCPSTHLYGCSSIESPKCLFCLYPMTQKFFSCQQLAHQFLPLIMTPLSL